MSVGQKSWEEFLEMRRELNQVRATDEEVRDFLDRVDVATDYLIAAFRSGKKHFKFPVVPAAKLKKIWLDFGRTGVVRDEKGMDRIATRVLDNIALLYVTTLLSGHTQHSPDDHLEDRGYGDIDTNDDRFLEFLTEEGGGYLLSDYGLPLLQAAYPLILRAKTAEEQLYAVDKALNVIHQRSDLAAWFVEGGSRTLMQVATQV